MKPMEQQWRWETNNWYTVGGGSSGEENEPVKEGYHVSFDRRKVHQVKKRYPEITAGTLFTTWYADVKPTQVPFVDDPIMEQEC